jgi:protein involved in sex pheromone biosynthesis
MLLNRTLAVVLACGLLFLAGCSHGGGSNTDEISQIVKRSMQQTLSTDANFFSDYHLQVLKVVVVKTSGNEYQGMATVRTPKGTETDVPVQVTADGANVQWKTEPGAFLFAAQEELYSSPPYGRR